MAVGLLTDLSAVQAGSRWVMAARRASHVLDRKGHSNSAAFWSSPNQLAHQSRCLRGVGSPNPSERHTRAASGGVCRKPSPDRLLQIVSRSVSQRRRRISGICGLAAGCAGLSWFASRRRLATAVEHITRGADLASTAGRAGGATPCRRLCCRRLVGCGSRSKAVAGLASSC